MIIHPHAGNIETNPGFVDNRPRSDSYRTTVNRRHLSATPRAHRRGGASLIGLQTLFYLSTGKKVDKQKKINTEPCAL